MKELVFIIVVSFGQPTVRVDTAYARVFYTSDPGRTRDIAAIFFYDKEYFKKFSEKWKCSSCELIDVKHGKLLPMESKK